MKLIPNWRKMPMMWSVQLATLGGILELLYQNWGTVSDLIPQNAQDVIRVALMVGIIIARGTDQNLDLKDDFIK